MASPGSYRVEFTQQALHDLGRLDPNIAQRVLGRLKRSAALGRDLRHEPLEGPLHGLFKLRVGDYRAIYGIDHQALTLTVHAVNHRSRIYKAR